MSAPLGIDVSHHHRVLSFNDVVNAGVTMFGVKATEGATFTDPTLLDHRNGARQQPFSLVWYYHYATPGDPVMQAGRLMDKVGALRDNERLVLDLEGETAGDLPAPTTGVLRWLNAFYTEMLRAYSDRRPMLYSSKRIWNMLGNPLWDLAGEIDLIAPRYGSHPPDLPAPWSKYTLWQFSQTYTCPGVDRLCDASRFNGTLADLNAYAKLAPAAA